MLISDTQNINTMKSSMFNQKKRWEAMSKAIPRQQGFTLIELMVGITIGLLTLAVALGAIMISRGISGTVSDASQLQQQASYTFRVFGQQIRQAGSLRLLLSANNPAAVTFDSAEVVAFQTKTADFDPESTAGAIIVSGSDTPTPTISVGYQNYTEPVFPSGTPASLLRNCLGQEIPATPTLLRSLFTFNSANLEITCGDSAATQQPITQNVANMQVRYLVQSNAVTGDPSITYVNATTAAANWRSVFGIEMCIEIFGTEVIDIPAGTIYKNCSGNNVDISSSGSLPANRKNRLHMTFRNVYQLRSQGLTG